MNTTDPDHSVVELKRVKKKGRNHWSWSSTITSFHPTHQCRFEGRQSHSWWTICGGRVPESDCWREVWMQIWVCSWVGVLGVNSCASWSCGFRAPVDLQQGLHQQVHSWFHTSCRPGLMCSWTAGLPAGVEPPGLRHLRCGWSQEGCGWLIFSAPPPVWISDHADGGLHHQYHSLLS